MKGEEERRRRKKGNYHRFSLISTKSQTRFLYIFILWVKKRKEERGQGQRGRVEGRREGGKKTWRWIGSSLNKRKLKSRGNAFAHSNTVIKRRTTIETAMCNCSSGFRTSQSPLQSPHYPQNYSISGKVRSEELGCHGKRNKSTEKWALSGAHGIPLISGIISTTWISPFGLLTKLTLVT